MLSVALVAKISPTPAVGARESISMRTIAPLRSSISFGFHCAEAFSQLVLLFSDDRLISLLSPRQILSEKWKQPAAYLCDYCFWSVFPVCAESDYDLFLCSIATDDVFAFSLSRIATPTAVQIRLETKENCAAIVPSDSFNDCRPNGGRISTANKETELAHKHSLLYFVMWSEK